MAIVLDFVNEIETDFDDFLEALMENDGLRVFLAVDIFPLEEYNLTGTENIRLIPLEDFTCRRTVKGCNGTDISLDTRFGLVTNDFISFDFNTVGLIEDDGFEDTGLLISSDNPYYPIIAYLSVHFDFINDMDYGNSFILNSTELAKLHAIPFYLGYDEEEGFYFDNIGDKMYPAKYTEVMDGFKSEESI